MINIQSPKQISLKLFLITIAANVSGAALTTIYFSYLDSNVLQAPESSSLLTVTVSGIMTVGLLILGTSLIMRLTQPIMNWLAQMPSREKTDEVPEKLQRIALEFPLVNAVTNLGMWLIAGLFIGFVISMGHSFDWDRFLRVLFGTTVISGVTTTALIYFAIEQAWKSVLPSFFPKGNITKTPATRISVRWRLLILFVMAMIPLFLLAVISYNAVSQITSAPYPLELLSKFRSQELFIIGVSVIGMIALAFTLGTSLVEPLDRLIGQMAAVQRGELDAYLPANSNDEYGELIDGFNAMLNGLRREEVIRSLFGRYVTPQVANYAIKHGAELGGQVVQASVLFADIRGFTSLTEQIEPPALIDMLNRYFETMASVISTYGGLVNKFGGDSLLALFGSPLNLNTQHAPQAVRAAQGLIAALEEFNRIQSARGEATLEIGVGVATGAVVVGNVGSRERLEYTALGNTVNLAARLQSMTRSLNSVILLDETTAMSVQSWAKLESIGLVDVRGKSNPEHAYALR